MVLQEEGLVTVLLTPLFPAWRIKQGGRKGGEKGSLDERMQTLGRPS